MRLFTRQGLGLALLPAVAAAVLIFGGCVEYTAPPARPLVKSNAAITIQRLVSRVDADAPMLIFIDGARSNFYLTNGETELIPIDEGEHTIYVQVGTFQSETLEFTANQGTISFAASVESREITLSRTDAGSGSTAKTGAGKGPKLGWTPLPSCQDGGWSSVPISDKVDYNLLYDDIVSRISRSYEIDMISKETGYIRTKWNNRNVTNGQVTNSYRTKVTMKLSPQRSKIEVNAEAEKLEDEGWVQGCDTQLLENLKQDLRGLSGY
jgi:hypothetical protein